MTPSPPVVQAQSWQDPGGWFDTNSGTAAALDGGYVWTKDTNSDTVIHLYATTDTTVTLVDSHDFADDGYANVFTEVRYPTIPGLTHDSGMSGAWLYNADLGVWTDAVHVGHAGDAFTLATFATDAYGISKVHVVADGSGWVVRSFDGDGYRVYAGYALDGVTQWSWPLLAEGLNLLEVGFPRPDRLLLLDTDTNLLELRDDTGALLDSLDTFDVEWTFGYRFPAGADRFVMFSRNDDGVSGDLSYRVLDTSGDVLAWLDAVATFTTGWTDTYGGAPSSWDGQVVWPSATQGDPWYWINPVTQARVTSSPPDAQGTATALSWSRTLAQGGSAWLLTPATTPPTPTGGRRPNLRQRQRWT